MTRFLGLGFDICNHPQILKYVEGILGPNFFMWERSSSAKNRIRTQGGMATGRVLLVARTTSFCHRMARLHGCRRLERSDARHPATHNKGLIKHRRIDDNSILTMELENGTYNESDAKTLCLKSGQLSLHDDNIVHGSPPNTSDRWRIGLTIRYSGTHVRETSGNPYFKAYLMNGVDEFKPNIQGEIPTAQFTVP